MFKSLFLCFLRSIVNVLSNEIGAIGVTPWAALPAQSQRLGFDSELRMKSLLQSIYVDLKGHYNAETKTMKPGIYMEIQDAALSNSHTATITMALHLAAAGVMGNQVAIGREELIRTRAATIYRNNCRKVVSNPEYGVRRLDQDYLNLRKQNVDNLGTWNKDEEDLEIHQALLEQFGETLYWGDRAALCVPNWNANMFIAGRALNGGHPAYSEKESFGFRVSGCRLNTIAEGGGRNKRRFQQLIFLAKFFQFFPVMGGQVDEFDSRAETSILIRANPNNLRIDLDGFHVLAQGNENGQIDPLSDP